MIPKTWWKRPWMEMLKCDNDSDCMQTGIYLRYIPVEKFPSDCFCVYITTQTIESDGKWYPACVTLNSPGIFPVHEWDIQS